MFHEQFETRKQNLIENISDVNMQIKPLSKNDFICTKNGSYHKWYQTNGKERIYIPKSERPLAEELATKKYLSLLLEDYEQEKRAIDFYLKHHNPGPGKAQQFLLESPEIQKLLEPYFKSFPPDTQEWMTSYEKNPHHPEALIHKTASGNMVRSKSEALIDLSLYTHKIPFRYEAPLTLGSRTIYPDFTIPHPVSNQLFYWEHLGMMDNADYAKTAFSKLELYTSHGIIPSVHLLVTYETKNHPLDSEYVEALINHYFL